MPLPDLLPAYFPGIRDHQLVEDVLTRGVDAAALFQRTRLVGAAGPVPRIDASTDEPTEACAQLMRDARAFYVAKASGASDLESLFAFVWLRAAVLQPEIHRC